MASPFSGVLYKTINGGVSWYEVSPNSPDIDFRSIYFPSNLTGYAVGGYEFGSSGVIYKTTDAGETWIQQGIVNKDLNSVHFWDNNTGYTENSVFQQTATPYASTSATFVDGSDASCCNVLGTLYFQRPNLHINGITIDFVRSAQ